MINGMCFRIEFFLSQILVKMEFSILIFIFFKCIFVKSFHAISDRIFKDGPNEKIILINETVITLV